VLVPDGGTVQVRHVYGASVVRAIASMLGDPRTFGQAYNLCQDETPRLVDVLGMLRDLTGSPAPLVPVPTTAIEAAGLEVVKVSPFSTRWMSFLDPTRAQTELGFVHQALPAYLASIVASLLAHWPPEAPPAYARRAEEIRLAAAQ
jgi:nucleoside-diphosphate-sugar epimerase